MLNFVVCEDNKVILQKNIDIINSVMFKNNINYRVYSFSSFSEELKELMNSNIGQIIYILDIELEDVSGLDIAAEIRKKDLDSFIIISTSYIDYLPYTLKSKLMLFDFISKFENYEQNLLSVLYKILASIKKTSSNKSKIYEHIKCSFKWNCICYYFVLYNKKFFGRKIRFS